MRDGDFHLYSSIGTLVAAVVMSVGVWRSEGCTRDVSAKTEDPFANMTVIDAALAEVAKQPDKQPQKEFRPPPPPDEPEGVSTKIDDKPADKKDEVKDKPPPDVDPSKVLDKYRDKDDELPVGKPTKIERGVIGGSEVGFGDKTFGDPYLGALKSSFLRGWEYPEILSEVGTPIGCIKLKEDGSIDDVKLMQPSGNGDLDNSVEKALADFQKKVNQDPKPLPPNLKELARIPLCWRMKV